MNEISLSLRQKQALRSLFIKQTSPSIIAKHGHYTIKEWWLLEEIHNKNPRLMTRAKVRVPPYGHLNDWYCLTEAGLDFVRSLDACKPA